MEDDWEQILLNVKDKFIKKYLRKKYFRQKISRQKKFALVYPPPFLGLTF